MKKYPFKKIDAFTTGISEGNPAACIYLDNVEDINAEGMQRIARELKGFVNEVAYLSCKDGIYHLCYYSSECEVDFCGHATIAIMFDLIKCNPALLSEEKINIVVKNNALTVLNKIKEDHSVYVTSPAPEYLSCDISIEDISKALKASTDVFNKELPVEIVKSGLKTLIIPIGHLKSCLEIYPDESSLKEFCLKNHFDIILVFTEEVSNKLNDYRTRVFAPKFGYLEDPATGSGNSAFGYYLLKHNLWKKPVITIEQNRSLGNPNIVRLVNTVEAGMQRVLFGGSAAVKIEGEYFLS